MHEYEIFIEDIIRVEENNTVKNFESRQKQPARKPM